MFEVKLGTHMEDEDETGAVKFLVASIICLLS